MRRPPTRRPGEGRGRLARVRRALAAGALVALGGGLGVVFATVSGVPEVLLERLTGSTVVVPLEPSPASPPEEPLQGFVDLQSPDGAPRGVRPPPPLPPVATRPSPEPAPAKRVPAPQRVAEISERREPPAPSAKSVIEELRSRGSRSTAPSGRVVQVGAYAGRAPAQALVERLERRGFHAFVSAASGGANRWRVRVRPPGGGDAEALAGRLRAAGYDTWVTTE
jgi:hypothetical protein